MFASLGRMLEEEVQWLNDGEHSSEIFTNTHGLVTRPDDHRHRK